MKKWSTNILKSVLEKLTKDEPLQQNIRDVFKQIIQDFHDKNESEHRTYEHSNCEVKLEKNEYSISREFLFCAPLNVLMILGIQNVELIDVTWFIDREGNTILRFSYPKQAVEQVVFDEKLDEENMDLIMKKINLVLQNVEERELLYLQNIITVVATCNTREEKMKIEKCCITPTLSTNGHKEYILKIYYTFGDELCFSTVKKVLTIFNSSLGESLRQIIIDENFLVCCIRKPVEFTPVWSQKENLDGESLLTPLEKKREKFDE